MTGAPTRLIHRALKSAIACSRHKAMPQPPHRGTSISKVCDLHYRMGGRVRIWFVVITMTAVWVAAVYFVFSQPISGNNPLSLSLGK
jgi:hypothetical protein